MRADCHFRLIDRDQLQIALLYTHKSTLYLIYANLEHLFWY